MDKLTMLEKVIATMDAKHTRTVITICNNRLADLGEPVHKSGPKAPGFRRRRPYYCKEIPDPCADTVTNFTHVKTDWVNDIEKHGKPCLLSTKDQQNKAVYMVVEYIKGEDLTLPNGILVPNCKVLAQASTVYDCVTKYVVGLRAA